MGELICGSQRMARELFHGKLNLPSVNARLKFFKSVSFWKLFQTFSWYLVDPIRAEPKVELVNVAEWYKALPSSKTLEIRWEKGDLGWGKNEKIEVQLFGYYEEDDGPHFDYLQVRTLIWFRFLRLKLLTNKEFIIILEIGTWNGKYW